MNGFVVMEYLTKSNDHSVAADDGRTAFNVISQVDLEIIAKASQYSLVCFGEGSMHDTSMMFGVLGEETYKGKAEFVTELFAISGTGQVNAVMSLD